MILVTSAYGNQGKLLVPKLLANGHHVRACVRTEASAARLRQMGAQEVAVGDLADLAFLSASMVGITSVYYVGPTLHPEERSIGFAMVDAAREAKVDHFVFSSVLHAITTDLVQHEIKRDIEEHLLSSGLEFTILQPANYMLPARLASVVQERVFRLPWSLERHQSMVDLEDVTDVAATVFTEPERHFAATYELVGPGRFTAHDIGRTLSQVLGHEIKVERLDLNAFVRARFGDGDTPTADYQARLMRAIEARYSAHDFLGNSNVLTWLLGRPPTSFSEFAARAIQANESTVDRRWKLARPERFERPTLRFVV